MNVAANVTNVPIFEFEARAVGAIFNVTQLVISNDEETFATNATGTNGLSKLTWYKDDGNGAYDGVDIEKLVDYIDLDDTDDTTVDTVPPDNNE